MRAEDLKARLAAAGELAEWPDAVPAELADVTADSRKAGAGALFIAYAGTDIDSHTFLPAVAEAGAGAALVERRVEGVAMPQVVVRDGRRAAAIAAALHYGDPADALDLLAVTGTNGKTTSVGLLRYLFGVAHPAGSIGTLGAIDGAGQVIPGTQSLTTPGPVELQGVLAELLRRGVRTVAMEASSHSLHQSRLYGLRFRAAVFTNLTREHLDYHVTLEAYLAAKLRLTDYLRHDGIAVVNADDRAWDGIPPGVPKLTFGITSPADVRATKITGSAHGMRFCLSYKGRDAWVDLPLLGRFNIENALGAAAAALGLGAELDDVAARLAAAPQVPGRMERLAAEPCVILRDYAHTPDAYERVLASLRPLVKGRLIMVFGCGGDRDRGKRPIMGAIAGRDADLVILTSDNPRTEDPERILDDIEEGMGEIPHLRISDRHAAITRAIRIARAEDMIVLIGKGHETYQIIGKVKEPFDERQIVLDVTSGRNGG